MSWAPGNLPNKDMPRRPCCWIQEGHVTDARQSCPHDSSWIGLIENEKCKKKIANLTSIKNKWSTSSNNKQTHRQQLGLMQSAKTCTCHLKVCESNLKMHIMLNNAHWSHCVLMHVTNWATLGHVLNPWQSTTDMPRRQCVAGSKQGTLQMAGSHAHMIAAE